jgi:hypothetical protein
VSAHVPTGYIHDADQTEIFGSARHYELSFQRYVAGPDIRPDYIFHINSALRLVHVTALFWDFGSRKKKKKKKKGGVQEEKPQKQGLRSKTDVLEVELTITPDEIILHLIGIRPCFVGYKLFQIVMYQLLRSALGTGRELCVKTCLPRTVEILQHFFSPSVMSLTGRGFTDCVFSDLCEMSEITPDTLGIPPDYITESEDGEVQLLPAAFPSAAQLNDPTFVDAHFAMSRHGSIFNK